MDVALSKICKNFDINHYTKVQQAYRLLGKTQVSIYLLRKLQRIFMSQHEALGTVMETYFPNCCGLIPGGSLAPHSRMLPPSWWDGKVRGQAGVQPSLGQQDSIMCNSDL